MLSKQDQAKMHSYDNKFINSISMSEANKISVNNMLKISRNDQTGKFQGNSTFTESNKLLSPFTWSNLNIKLPKLSKQIANPVIVEQKNNEPIKRFKRKSQNKQKIKLDAIHRTIHISSSVSKEVKNDSNEQAKIRYRKQSINKSINLDDEDRNTTDNPQRLKLYKRDLIARHLHKGLTRQQSPHSLFNRTTNDFSRIQSQLSSHAFKLGNCTAQTFSYNKMQTFIYKGLAKASWCEVAKDSQIIPEMVWSDHYLQHTKFKADQLHNHIKNIHLLTTKNSLHDIQSACGSQHYPMSFLMPFQYENFCEQYQTQIVKICLKQIIRNAYSRINLQIRPNNLGKILQEIKSKSPINEDTIMILRLCLYLEQYRQLRNYRYTDFFEQYTPIQTQLQPSVLCALLRACYQYWGSIVKLQNDPRAQSSPYFKTTNVNPQILSVLWGYHCLLLKCEADYQNISNRNMWIVKPIASSRGAGISLLKNSIEFLSINHEQFELTNKTKYGNKIIQKYIEQPMLIKQMKQFEDRKFDIRQWVLLTCDKQTNQPLIYIYEDGYCRFSDMKFSYNHYRSDEAKVHLTNYSVSDKSNPQNSLLLLSNFFNKYAQLKDSYYCQVSKIVVQTIMNAKDIVLQPNRFELLGYDVMLDRHNKLWLLQINMNPACQVRRSQKLQQIADKMIADMMKIVKASSGKTFINQKQRSTLGWKIIYGEEKFLQVDLQESKIIPIVKPFYQVSLGQDSLIQQVRRRNLFSASLVKVYNNFHLRQIWQKLIKYEPSKVQETTKQNDNKIMEGENQFSNLTERSNEVIPLIDTQAQ